MITFLAILFIFALLIMSHELGHFLTAKLSGVKVNEFGFGFPPRVAAVRRGETEYSLNLIPFGGFVRLEGMEDPTVPRGLAGKRIRTRLLVLTSGSVMNGLLPFLLLSLAFMVPQRVVAGGEAIQVYQVAAGSPAEAVGLRSGDLILNVEGQAVTGFNDLSQAIRARLGQETILLIQREGQEREVKLVPRQNPPPNEGPLGVALSWYHPIYKTRYYAPWEAVPRGFVEGGRLFKALVTGLAGIVSGKEAAEPIGFVGVAQATAEVSQQGLNALLVWAAILSATLAIMNLVPFPLFDGWHIAFLAIEKARRGRRFSPERLRQVQAVALVFFVALVVLLTYNDLARLLRRESVFP